MSEMMLGDDIYGIENEYSILVRGNNNVIHEFVGECHSIDSELELYVQPDNRGTASICKEDYDIGLSEMNIFSNEGGMLSNGGRYYIDPSGPEYATPETTTAEEAVHRTFDGDEIVLGVFRNLVKRGEIDGFQLNRKIVDHNRTSRGVHLNNSTSLFLDDPKHDIKLVLQLATLNVVKGALFGSGGLLVDEDGQTAYHHSPRLSLTDGLAANYQEYKQRPLVRYPFKADGNLSRVETVTSDALNYAWPLKASLVVTNALLRIIELGEDSKLPIINNPVRAALNVGLHGNNNQISVKYPNKKRMGVFPSDILKDICEVILDSNNNHGVLSAEAEKTLPEIIDVCDKIKVDPYSVANQVESIGRLVAMEKKMQKSGIKLDSEQMCRFDYAWDWIGGGGIAERLRKNGVAGWQGFSKGYSVTETKKRLSKPPADTRAKVRGDMIKESVGYNESSWTDIDVGEGVNSYKVYFSPLKSEI